MTDLFKIVVITRDDQLVAQVSSSICDLDDKDQIGLFAKATVGFLNDYVNTLTKEQKEELFKKMDLPS